jgi:hypothetical protein
MNNLKGKTKEEAIEIIKNQEISKKDILHLLYNLKRTSFKLTPNAIKIGDVYMNKELAHPCLIIGIKGNVCHSLMLTSNPEIPHVDICKSRFYNEGVISYTFIINSIEYTTLNFQGVYENRTHVREIKKLFKNYIKNI